MNKSELHIKCDCGQEILQIKRAEDIEDLFYLSLYEVPAPVGMALWWRLGNAWRTFWSGKFPINEIVITREDKESLAAFLDSVREPEEKL